MILARWRAWLKPPWVKWVVEIVLILAVYFAVRAYLQRDMPSGPVPAVLGTTLSGEYVELAALAKQQQRPVLLHFWATWCGICKFEQDSIQAISHDHAVLSIATQSGDRQAVQRYLDEHGLVYPVLLDEHGELMRRFGLRGVPATLVIDRNGEIAFRETGYTTEWGLRIRLWLAQ